MELESPGRHLRGRLPHATLEVVPGAGHLLAADVTGVLRREIERILSSADAAARGPARNDS